MRDFAGKRYWLVGASEGLGLALAQRMGQAGAQLILSARSPEGLAKAAASIPGGAQTVPMDVADTASVRSAAAQVGEVDGLVFLAGVYWPMRAQDWDADKAEAMLNVNATGCTRVVGAVLPQMVARNAGHIVITGSLSGFRGLPGAIGYAASKAATMVLAESLYADLRNTGITVQQANPGFIRTRLTAQNDFQMPFILEPEAAAQIMFDHMARGGFKRSFPTLFSWLFRGGQFLPDALWYRMFPPGK
ncbi:SDR family NAD(P)-dependent oxidoreductase [Rhodobacter sp. Har01]|uniref:SDR family NAD(P)-dependent oxidoreductase n=1 Tax=Rhodobacter sp. Har01 TaxID=2883999 RepID=UPI001D0924CF|nr:SDR family NAD(P)-dependent oxidoreductase [Rhodobacter sp. Har01]MCB6179464.1 SDR family NAD(P)-dependent oxidoreductase [Rhodobacter sp. Har01]